VLVLSRLFTPGILSTPARVSVSGKVCTSDRADVLERLAVGAIVGSTREREVSSNNAEESLSVLVIDGLGLLLRVNSLAMAEIVGSTISVGDLTGVGVGSIMEAEGVGVGGIASSSSMKHVST
jgi:hypothetical protein